MNIRCGKCGRADGSHDQAKHDLFDRMLVADCIIEPLSPLRRDLNAAHAQGQSAARPNTAPRRGSRR